MEQVPRLLAAMHFVALDDKTSAGSFEMFSCFHIVRRIFDTGLMIDTKLNTEPDYNINPTMILQNLQVEKDLTKDSNQHVGFLVVDFKIELNEFRKRHLSMSKNKISR